MPGTALRLQNQKLISSFRSLPSNLRHQRCPKPPPTTVRVVAGTTDSDLSPLNRGQKSSLPWTSLTIWAADIELQASAPSAPTFLLLLERCCHLFFRKCKVSIARDELLPIATMMYTQVTPTFPSCPSTSGSNRNIIDADQFSSWARHAVWTQN